MNFSRNYPKFHIFPKILNFLKYNLKFSDLLLLLYKFHSRDMLGIYFLIFASCEPLMLVNMLVQASIC